MNKKFLVAALAGLVTVCGFAAQGPAQEQSQEQETQVTKIGEVKSLDAKEKMRIVAIAHPNTNLASKLTTVRGVTAGGLTRGYLVKSSSGETTFKPLSEAISENVSVSTDSKGNELVSLGTFSKNDTVQFGFQDKQGGFTPMSISVLSSDPAYYAGYNADSFYQLDFSEDAFDGQIDVLVMGEPLPGPTVTLILSLAALAVFMGYARRKQQNAHAVQES